MADGCSMGGSSKRASLHIPSSSKLGYYLSMVSSVDGSFAQRKHQIQIVSPTFSQCGGRFSDWLSSSFCPGLGLGLGPGRGGTG